MLGVQCRYATLGEFIAWVVVSNMILVRGWISASSICTADSVCRNRAACFMPHIASRTHTQQYILANAAAVRGFAPYMALLFNKPTNFFLKPWNGYLIDGGQQQCLVISLHSAWPGMPLAAQIVTPAAGVCTPPAGWAGGVTLLCTCLLSWGMQESATANAIITVASNRQGLHVSIHMRQTHRPTTC